MITAMALLGQIGQMEGNAKESSSELKPALNPDCHSLDVLEKLHKLCEPHFPHLQNGVVVGSTSLGFGEY